MPPEWVSEKAVTTQQAAECVEHGWGYDVDEETGCWLWRVPASTGYGPYLSFFETAHGHPHQDYEIHHTCFRGHDGCVNPQHLEELTPEQHQNAHRFSPKRDAPGWARALKAERQAREWSQTRMANELGVHPQTLKKWELAERPPSRQLQRIIGHVLGWELEARKFVVTVAIQDVVAAHSSGEAIKEMLATLPEPTRGVRKREVVDVRIVK